MKSNQKTKKLKPLIVNGYYAITVILVFVLIIAGLFAISFFDKDKTVSELENRTLKQKPKLSVGSVLDGTYSKDFEEYYSDTFPFRDAFLKANNVISDTFSKNTASDDGMVIVEVEGKDDFDGQSID